VNHTWRGHFHYVFCLFQVVFSKYTDMLPKEVLNEDHPELQKPDEEAVKEVRYETENRFKCRYLLQAEIGLSK